MILKNLIFFLYYFIYKQKVFSSISQIKYQLTKLMKFTSKKESNSNIMVMKFYCVILLVIIFNNIPLNLPVTLIYYLFLPV